MRVLLEGCIISYNNIITGGFGARYFGTGGSVNIGKIELLFI
jgi:curli production assembly/transport component CsgG